MKIQSVDVWHDVRGEYVRARVITREEETELQLLHQNSDGFEESFVPGIWTNRVGVAIEFVTTFNAICGKGTEAR